MSLDELKRSFLLSLRRRDLSPQTWKAYNWALHDLIAKFMAPKGLTQLGDLTRMVLEQWQDTFLDRPKPLRPRSRSLAVTAARQFIRWMVDQEVIDAKVERGLARVKIPEGTPHPIPKADLDKLKAYFLASPDLRARALFFVLLTTGARIAEALRMPRDDYVNPEVIQKGGTTKRLMAPAEVHEMVRAYLASRIGDQSNDLLWGDFSPADARALWKRVAKELGTPYFTTHALRHTCATELLRAGIPEIVIAEHLGHHGLGTIRNYTKVLEGQRQTVVDAMSALVQP